MPLYAQFTRCRIATPLQLNGPECSSCLLCRDSWRNAAAAFRPDGPTNWSHDATALTQLVWPCSVCTSWPVAGSHSLTVLSSDPEASSLPSWENATACTESVWPCSVCTFWPVAGSYSLTVSSPNPEASSLLSWKKATAFT